MSNNKRPNYVRYTPKQDGAQEKVIRLVEVQKDPMEPARFKLNKKVPPPPPSPPAPIMHSPPRKTTAEEHVNWNVPPCISSWKNPRGYVIPNDKRIALAGKNSSQPAMINPKFAQFTEALAIGARQHRIAIEERTKAERLMSLKEKDRQEENLRLLAQQAREERASHRKHDRSPTSEDEEYEERRKIRSDRHRERVRNLNMNASGSKLNRERDISEQIALGVARPDQDDTDPHDQRLYNQPQGVTSGFADEDDYAVYDKPWKSQASHSKSYRPSADIVQEQSSFGEASTISTAKDDVLEPIKFDKDVQDIFLVNEFLQLAKQTAKKKQF